MIEVRRMNPAAGVLAAALVMGVIGSASAIDPPPIPDPRSVADVVAEVEAAWGIDLRASPPGGMSHVIVKDDVAVGGVHIATPRREHDAYGIYGYGFGIEVLFGPLGSEYWAAVGGPALAVFAFSDGTVWVDLSRPLQIIQPPLAGRPPFAAPYMDEYRTIADVPAAPQ